MASETMNKQENRLARLDCWADALQQIGTFVVGFQELEATVAASIAAMIGRDKRMGRVITAELSFRAKLNVFSALFLHRLKATELPEDVREVLAKVDQAGQRRNAVVHSIWHFPTARVPDLVRREKVRAHRKKGLLVDGEVLSPDELDDESRQFERIAEDVVYVLEEHLPACAKRL